ncbi:MAG: class I SAM-dependent RNA methyltransferase [Hyphomicrobiaceae bacterium]
MDNAMDNPQDQKRLKIDRLGAGGDGVVDTPDGPIFVAGGLPGDVVNARIVGDRAKIESIEQKGDGRVDPVCRHFGVCGGCAVQGLAIPEYREWKRNKISTAFQARGLEVEVSDAIAVGHGERRRATFTVSGSSRNLVFGFNAAKSHDVFEVAECPVLAPEIVAALPDLKAVAAFFVTPNQPIRVSVTKCVNGLDVAFQDVKRALNADQLLALATTAREAGFIKVTTNDELVISQAAPVVAFGEAQVELPLGSFLQASLSAEREMANLILKAMPKKTKNVADLFCGLGAFTFPLAKKYRVSAFDGDRGAIAALTKSAGATAGIKPIKAVVRDLFQAPLSRVELRDFDAVVFDPPRAGAIAQAQALVKSKVATVVAVSCNPATLARDVRMLVDGGYAIKKVVPIDQFLYSPHIECIVTLTR